MSIPPTYNLFKELNATMWCRDIIFILLHRFVAYMIRSFCRRCCLCAAAFKLPLILLSLFVLQILLLSATYLVLLLLLSSQFLRCVGKTKPDRITVLHGLVANISRLYHCM